MAGGVASVWAHGGAAYSLSSPTMRLARLPAALPRPAIARPIVARPSPAAAPTRVALPPLFAAASGTAKIIVTGRHVELTDALKEYTVCKWGGRGPVWRFLGGRLTMRAARRHVRARPPAAPLAGLSTDDPHRPGARPRVGGGLQGARLRAR